MSSTGARVVAPDGGRRRRLPLFGSVAFSPGGSYIAGDDGKARGLTIVRPDGSRHLITHGTDSFGSWSPDARFIAFTRYHGGSTTVETTTRNGRHKRIVAANGRDPQWSPTGDWIAYSPCDPTGDCAGITLTGPDGTGARRLTAASDPTDAPPSWAPGGKQLVFQDHRHVTVIDTKGHTRRIAAGFGPKWSPNGRWIAYDTGEGIAVIGANGSGRHTVARLDSFSDASFTWAPDSGELAYTAGTKLRLVAVTGGHAVTVATVARGDEYLCCPTWQQLRP